MSDMPDMSNHYAWVAGEDTWPDREFYREPNGFDLIEYMSMNATATYLLTRITHFIDCEQKYGGLTARESIEYAAALAAGESMHQKMIAFWERLKK